MTIPTITAIKNSSYFLAIASVCTWLKIDETAVTALSALIVLDVFTGVLRAGFLRGWRSVTSSRFERGIISKLLLLLIPLSLALGLKGMGIPSQDIFQSAIALMILSELYSILGNVIAIQTGEDKEEMCLMSLALGKIQNKLKILFDNSTI